MTDKRLQYYTSAGLVLLSSIGIYYYYRYYYLKYKILSFSTKYCSKHGLQWLDCKRCIKSIKSNNRKYIIVNTKPVSSGIHSWRIKVKNPTKQSIFWGISENKTYKDESFNDIVYGVFNKGLYINQKEIDGHWYGRGNNINMCYFALQQVTLDMRLDLDKNELRFHLIGNKKAVEYLCNEAIIFDLPPNRSWIPHFNMNGENQTLRIAQIPNEWYGKELLDIQLFP